MAIGIRSASARLAVLGNWMLVLALSVDAGLLTYAGLCHVLHIQQDALLTPVQMALVVAPGVFLRLLAWTFQSLSRSADSPSTSASGEIL